MFVNLVSISIFTAQDPRSSDIDSLVCSSCFLLAAGGVPGSASAQLCFAATVPRFPVVVGSLFECDCLQVEVSVVLKLPDQKAQVF
jgi:hypothetical protein